MNEMKRHSGWFWLLIGAGLLFGLIVVASVLGLLALHSFDSGGSFASIGGGNVGVIDIDGVIMSADSTVDQLRKFNDDDSIKAIVMHIDSPGGAAAPSQEIYNEVIRIRKEHKKPIVASIESVGASGAYYIASGANRIYANDASIVGSIGVIMEWTNYGDLLKWAKLQPEVIKGGRLKDAGSADRPMTPEERAYFQGLVDNMHAQFIRDVAAGRGIKPDQLKPLATGQVWTGEEALPLHLIDQAGGFRVALLDTAHRAGISGEPNVIKPARHHKTILDMLTTDTDSLFSAPEQLLEKHAGFYFLWR
ncbi:signal peptide peptidase A [Acidipila rosea]|uniref:Signal peptide peptidase A n=2 Tax=Acidipila rosea TaxID=768535 RepID=A0A4R1L1B4_9BACT|nr:signal peptide peptidase A [Acidipila rosea]